LKQISAKEENIVTICMFDDAMKKDGKLYVPYLMLFGILYCASNPLKNAEKFYELVQIELPDNMEKDDEEYVEYFPQLQKIAYAMIAATYIRYRDEFKSEFCLRPVEYGDLFADDMDAIFSELQAEMVEDFFKNAKLIEKDKFIKKLAEQHKDLL